jgi:hypothetical protein
MEEMIVAMEMTLDFQNCWKKLSLRVWEWKDQHDDVVLRCS